MSYTPHTWQSGETVTAEKLNVLEQGVASGGGGMRVSVITEEDTPQAGYTTQTMDKTWQQIYDALAAGMYVCEIDEVVGEYIAQSMISGVDFDGDNYRVYSDAAGEYLTTSSPNGYPTYIVAPLG